MRRDIYVDSRRRNDPYGNSYTLYIQTPLKNVTRVDLLSATLPNTMYNVTNGSNIFSISGSNCSISNGFYSSSSIVTAINAQIADVKLSFLSEQGKFMFYSSTGSFNLVVYSKDFTTITGFADSSSQLQSGTHFIKSDQVANFKLTGEYVYLDIEELRRPFAIDAVSNVYDSGSSTIFAIIPMDVSSGCIKTFKEQTDYRVSVEYPKPIDQIDRLTVNWRDFNGNLLNFNGVDENSFILRFYEDERKSVPVEEVQEPLPPLSKRHENRTVFVFMVLAFVFILFIKRK